MVEGGEEAKCGCERRLDVQLFIVHPTIDPADIEKTLGIIASHSHRRGDNRVTPKGNVLSGTYRDTRWRYSERYIICNQWFANKVETFLNTLKPHQEFLRNLVTTGGSATIIVGFLGDGYFGDEIPPATLTKIVELGLSLSIEVFTDPQT